VHGHEHLLHKRLVLLPPHARLLQPRIELVVDQRLRVRAHVDGHRQALVRVDPTTRRVQVQLANGDAHSVGPEVTEAEDALAVGDDDDVYFLVRPVIQNLLHTAFILDGNVHATRLLKDRSELLASLADSGRIEERHHLRDILNDEAIEQRFIPALERHEKHVFVEGICDHLELVHRSLDFILHREHCRRLQR